jgi:cytochrome c peroxidase
MRFRPLPFLLVLCLASCEQARRYPAPPARGDATKDVPREKAPLPSVWSWLPPDRPTFDYPIEFVPHTAPAWASLLSVWNADPSPATRATAFLGLPPLQALAAYGMTDQLQVFRIKVPAGLPDPNPLIPSANPPTYGKWRLGRDIFFAPVLSTGNEVYACKDCHRPNHRFAGSRRLNLREALNVPSLVNAVYNRHQFWDGHVVALEEVLVRSLEDERPGPTEPPELTHRWGGLVHRLYNDTNFRNGFEQVFRIGKPTQDAIAKALATYMRTLLSGDSLYDRAEARRKQSGKAALGSDHFLAVLDTAALEALGDGKLAKEEAARQLVLGYQLFYGKANCAACHRAPLFGDHDFHNIGLNKDSWPPPDAPTGRFTTVPIGLKERRLIGAYRTPSLRGRAGIGPYFHDGQRQTLHDVVRFYDHEIRWSPYLAAPLGSGNREQTLGLDAAEIDALVLFLQALDGGPLDPMVAAPSR